MDKGCAGAGAVGRAPGEGPVSCSRCDQTMMQDNGRIRYDTNPPAFLTFTGDEGMPGRSAAATSEFRANAFF